MTSFITRIGAGALALAILLPCRGGAAADGPALPAAAFRLAPQGSVFHFRRDKETRDVVVGKTDGYFVDVTANGKPRAAFLLSGVQPDYLTREELSDLVGIWPLAVGKTVRYRRQMPGGRSGSWSDELTVLRTEIVNVNGIAFDTYVVRWTSSGEYRNRWDATMTSWFAPSLGWVVKVTYIESTGVRWDEQLVSYELAR